MDARFLRHCGYRFVIDRADDSERHRDFVIKHLSLDPDGIGYLRALGVYRWMWVSFVALCGGGISSWGDFYR